MNHHRRSAGRTPPGPREPPPGGPEENEPGRTLGPIGHHSPPSSTPGRCGSRPTYPRTGRAVDARSSGGSAAFTPGTPAVAALPRPGSAVHLLSRRTALTAGSPGSPTRAAPTRPGRGHPKPQQAESYSWATAPRYGQHDHVMQLGPPSTPATTTRPSRTRSAPRPSRRWAVSWKPLVKSNASAVTITTTTITIKIHEPVLRSRRRREGIGPLLTNGELRAPSRRTSR